MWDMTYMLRFVHRTICVLRQNVLGEVCDLEHTQQSPLVSVVSHMCCSQEARTFKGGVQTAI